MKIKINPNEFYEISFPDEVNTGDELFGMIERLKTVLTFFRKNNNDNISQIIKHKRKTSNNEIYYNFNRNIISDKNRAIELLQFYYHGSKDDKMLLAKKLQVNWVSIQARMSNLRLKFGISCKEVGLIRFPTLSESKQHTNLTDKKFVYNKRLFNKLISYSEKENE